jgi:hypothetical protein
MFLGDARYMRDDCCRLRKCKTHFCDALRIISDSKIVKQLIHTVNTIINNVLRNGWHAIRFVSCFRAHCARKMLMFQEMVCRCGPIAVRSTLKPTSHPYPKKDNVRALTRAAQHLIKPTACEKWSCSKRWLVPDGIPSGQACPNKGSSN